MNNDNTTPPSDARQSITATIAQGRARRFAGTIGADQDTDPTRAGSADQDEDGMRADYLLQSLHTALSAQRTLWSAFEMLRTAVRIEVGHQLSDSALSYIGTLAASGIVDLVTHEHVAELLAIKDPAQPDQERTEGTTR